MVGPDGISDHIQHRFPPHALREYALLADGRRGAICGPHGDLVWLCAPTWHDDAVFAALLGGPGVYAVTPVEPFTWGGYYEPRSLIWRNRWVTTSTIVECRDALAYPGDPNRVMLLRRVEAIEREVVLRVELDVRAGFGTLPKTEPHLDEHGRWVAGSGDLRVRWSGGANAAVGSDGALRMEIAVPAGGRHDLVLEITRASLGPPIDPDLAWHRTEHAWHSDIPDLGGSIAPRDTQHAYAVLRGMTAPRGGMAAAATMSLPERAEQRRNYDYRYAWVRDQCYAAVAVAAAGPLPLLDDAVSFLTARLLDDGDALHPAYTVDGDVVPDERPLDLPGYPGGHEVVLGNRVTRQTQLDAFGELLQLLAAAARHGHLDTDGARAIRVAAEAIGRRWQRPDAGLWELDDQWWTHSRLACVAGLRAAAFAAPTREGSDRMTSLAEDILTETTRRCLHPNGYWQRSSQHTGPDAALLLPPVRGALPGDDPRTRATLTKVRRTLSEDGYLYRFPQPTQRPGETEGAFLLCGFVMALAEHQQGDEAHALRWFERNRAACGPPGLLSEEYDVQQRQLRGNLPQAFVHALLLESAIRLSTPATPARGPGRSR
ncbi:glycoside hydrolase family 15 protein [Saccharopolyspora spinosa]|uniref:GH15 family glucan-1,4-alpha-glucosidase n=1 Tax=Saccharopolyspora spinosa TaxID=60894 RepID=A0A2N3XYW4_SACSN|nr:glycoside hydrolase family 15 protein [Saccharopolyspora spinosa]PKW15842.1 GH15 family glucan-1,4-alpha-glucosidase [Saccharopolyspora spinosa]